ncbi:tetratricopeptide repeat protein [Chitinibacteraceae bacterium HSL-7]
MSQQVEFWMEQARTAAQAQRWMQAHGALLNALRLDPQSEALQVNMAVIERQLGRFAEARDRLEQVLATCPDYPAAEFNYANLLSAVGEPERARRLFEQLLRKRPDWIEARYNYGCTLQALGVEASACEQFDLVVQAMPHHAQAWLNLAVCQRALGNLQLARLAYEQAERYGETDSARYGLGTLDLAQGVWHSGWLGYEARWAACARVEPTIDLPRWDGWSGASVLLVSEQGLGDCLQFARLLHLVRPKVGRLSVVVPPALLGLMTQSFPDVGWLSHIDPDGHDCWLPLASLPGVLSLDEGRLRNLPKRSWRPTTPRHFVSGFRHVGLCWTGNPDQADNNKRTVPVGLLRELRGAPAVQWHNLQQGKGGQLRAAGFDVQDESESWKDFSATADYVSGLDLVITACTSIAHLAGGLGKPVWLMSRFDPDWRWMYERSDSPWYPSMRIFRQPGPGLWAPVIDDIRTAMFELE